MKGIFNIRGGARLAGRKDLTTAEKIITLPIADMLYIPLQQHVGTPAGINRSQQRWRITDIGSIRGYRLLPGICITNLLDVEFTRPPGSRIFRRHVPVIIRLVVKQFWFLPGPYQQCTVMMMGQRQPP